MKKIVTTLIAISLSTLCFAQNQDKVLARVSYNFTHVRDTTQKNDPYTENMLLVIGKNASIYTSYDRILRELSLDKPSRTAPFKPVTRIDYYYFAKENEFYTREKIITEYMAKEVAPKINWKITKDTASFSGVHCQKATTYFKGRNWIAWFAPDLPFQSGPWKLNGLPGLIIDAYDDKGDVKFQFSGIDNLNTQATTAEQKALAAHFYYGPTIKFPEDAKLTTKADLDKLRETRDRDPLGFAKASAPNDGRIVVMGASTTGVSHTVINNPIELPEKKNK